MTGITEQIEHVRLLVGLVADERLDDGPRGEPFVHEERQRRHVERQTLGLTRPVQERSTEPPQVLDCLGERPNPENDTAVWRLEFLWFG